MAWRIGAMIAWACATGVLQAAQQHQDTASSRMITVTGCVQRIDESGTLGTTIPERTPPPEQAGVAANSGEPANGFMLTDAEPSTANKPGRGATPPKMRYILIGDPVELVKYQGQRVRAEGALASVPTKPAESAPVGTAGSVEFRSHTARLSVTSIESIAPTCQ